MAKTGPPPAATPSISRPPGRPEVILDFAVEEGLLTVELANVGDQSAYRVRTTFSEPFHGADAKQPVSSLRLFRRLEFMPGGKRFRHLVDTLAGYARRKQPMRLEATVSYQDREGNRFQDRYPHDLRIYLELRSVHPTRPRSEGV